MSELTYRERCLRWRYVTEHATIGALDDCWTWNGSLTNGYGYAWYEAGAYRAHRFAYEAHHGAAVPAKFDLDHLCRNRACINPNHLEPVTRAENLRRGRNHWRERTHCSSGHPYDADNTRTQGGRRICVTCERAAKARWREKKRQEKRDAA